CSLGNPMAGASINWATNHTHKLCPRLTFCGRIFHIQVDMIEQFIEALGKSDSSRIDHTAIVVTLIRESHIARLGISFYPREGDVDHRLAEKRKIKCQAGTDIQSNFGISDRIGEQREMLKLRCKPPKP